MPRKAAASASTGEDSAAEQVAPRRSTRIASQPSTEEAKPAPKPRATKKRTAEGAGDGDTEGNGKAKAKKVLNPPQFPLVFCYVCGAHCLVTQAKAESAPENEAEESGDAAEPVPQLAPIDIGDTLPNLILKNEKEEEVQVADIAKEKGAVVFLVPKADTRIFSFLVEYLKFS